MWKRLTLALCALTVALPAAALAADQSALHDNFYWVGQMNKASLIINSEEGLLDKAFVPSFASAIQTVIDNGNNGGPRPGAPLSFEPYMIELAGNEITLLHAGRSTQDMLATAGYAAQKENLLALAEALNSLQSTLIRLAEEHADTIVPTYTNGVAAQPSSFGHYLLAFVSGFERDMERLQQYYTRLDHSAMGTTVLNGTSWPLNRERMAAYLGFPAFRDNAFDAGQVYGAEVPTEAGYLATSISLHISTMIEDIMQQYAQPRPWILLREGDGNTYASSAMPQKRNPGILNSARTLASTVVGDAITTFIRGHNVPTGMQDGRSVGNALMPNIIKLVGDFDYILNNLVINPTRSLEELNLDWTASQEIADNLMRNYGVPFRVGHHFASEVVSYAREHGITPSDFPYSEVLRIYAEVMAADGGSTEMPMSEAEFRATLDPQDIVRNRATVGGPQPAEVARMIGEARVDLANNTEWVSGKYAFLQAAEAKLNADFARLLP